MSPSFPILLEGAELPEYTATIPLTLRFVAILADGLPLLSAPVIRKHELVSSHHIYAFPTLIAPPNHDVPAIYKSGEVVLVEPPFNLRLFPINEYKDYQKSNTSKIDIKQNNNRKNECISCESELT